MSFLRRLLRLTAKDYELRALVSTRVIEPLDQINGATHVFCDLDKTYLETEFESWIKMAKIPFESPHDKITVPGASEVLEVLRWGGDPRRGETPRTAIHFVSSSPPQLRLALDGKLTLDHIEWSSDTFKNQTYNLRMARIDLLRHHIAYKTKAILDIATRLPPGSRVLMIGDNAEFDAFIYTGVRLYLERRITVSGLRDWLRGAKVEDEVIGQVVSQSSEVPDGLSVSGIYIRSLPGYANEVASRFEGTWFKFEHWAQVAWSLIADGIIAPTAMPLLMRSFHNLHGVPLAHLRWCLMREMSQEKMDSGVRRAAEECLNSLGGSDASGPSRRMLSWELSMGGCRAMDATGVCDAKADSSQWYQSIEAARILRKQSRRSSSRSSPRSSPMSR